MHPRPVTEEGERKAAFARYVVPEIDVLYRVALTLADSVADAEDLVQDTLLRAYRGVSSFDGRHPRAWLLTILRNAHLNLGRRRGPELLRDPYPAAAVGPADGAPGPEGLVVDCAFDAAVASAVEALPLKMRRVLQLVDLAPTPRSPAAGPPAVGKQKGDRCPHAHLAAHQRGHRPAPVNKHPFGYRRPNQCRVVVPQDRAGEDIPRRRPFADRA